MIKSLNDSLREEFASILSDDSIKELIQKHNLSVDLINRAFTKLLENKSGAEVEDLVKRGRAEFETFIINTLKTNKAQ